MRNYENGKIYKVICESGLIYVGSTIRTLKERFREHKKPSNKCSCKGFINPRIELIENYPCNNMKELEERERYYIENSNQCVNTQIPTQTRKEYLEKNHCIMRQKAKVNYQNNREKIIEKNKEYSKTIDRREYYKQWRKNNVEKCKGYDLKKLKSKEI